MAQRLNPSRKARNQSDEYATFASALKKVLSVPHAELKAKLDDEKRSRQPRGKRASSSRVSGNNG
jgi:hypothetical protein